MIVGVLQAELRIEWARSLKDKRSVARSLKDRLHREHQVSVAEVEAQEIHNTLVLGVAAAGSSTAQVLATLDTVRDKLAHHPEAELVADHRELLSGWAGSLAGAAFTAVEERTLASEMLARATTATKGDDAQAEEQETP
jgi:uncharacterized protein YlxP (DUF503 family)|tara:strand:- start:26532 stop:26948 length:417 start_codon:yes stop_codon:yes gene_type:complete